MTEAPNTWLLGPAASCTTFLADGLAILTLVERGLFVIGQLPPIVDAAAPTIRGRSRDAGAALASLREQARSDAKLADMYKDKHVPAMRRQFCVANWSAVETMIEETLVNHLVKVPNSYDLVEAIWPKLAKRRPSDPTDRSEARIYFRSWERATDEKNVVDRAFSMFAPFHLQFEIDSIARNNLTELCEFRNICLHRGGVVDEGFLDKVPWSTRSVDTVYDADRDDVIRFYEACGTFTTGLLGRVTKSPWIYKKPSS